MGKVTYIERFREQRMAIKMCYGWGMTGEETRKLIKTVYGGDAMSRTQIYTWYSRFKAGRKSTEDDPRSGRPVTVSVSKTADKLRDLMYASDRKPTIREMATKLNISYGMCHAIVTELLADSKAKRSSEEMVSSVSVLHDKGKIIFAADSNRNKTSDLEALEAKLKLYLDANTSATTNENAVS